MYPFAPVSPSRSRRPLINRKYSTITAKPTIIVPIAAVWSFIILIDTQLTELTPQYTTLQTELTFWQSEFERELNGQRSGLVGESPRARSIRSDQLEPRRE